MLWGGWLLLTAPGLPNPLHAQEQGGGIIESEEYFTQGTLQSKGASGAVPSCPPYKVSDIPAAVW